MARVTVEDCVIKIPNRFELVMLASQRSRNISAGAQLTVERDNDKNPVVALREIAEETVEPDELEASLVKGLQKFVEVDEPEEDEVDFTAMQLELSNEIAAASGTTAPAGTLNAETSADDDSKDSEEDSGHVPEEGGEPQES